MVEEENFLERWSRRKGGQDGEADKSGAPEGIETKEAEIETDQTETPQDAPDEPAPWEGIDIDALDADSDYTPFMAEGVPTDVKASALDKLWRSDPVLANLDGLNDYDLDYSSWGMVTEVVKSAYKVGQGFLTDEEVAQNEREYGPNAEQEKMAEDDVAEEKSEELETVVESDKDQTILQEDSEDDPVEATPVSEKSGDRDTSPSDDSA